MQPLRPLPAVALAAVLTAALPAAGCSAPVERGGPSGPSAAAPGPAGTPVVAGEPPAGARAHRVLLAWQQARADAYARGSVQRLRDLYLGGAGRVDVQLLRGYLRRGLTVEELTVQLLGLEVLDQSPGRLRLRVTERLARAVAVGPAARQVLPRSQPVTRVVVLVRRTDGWRVAFVGPAGVSGRERP